MAMQMAMRLGLAATMFASVQFSGVMSAIAQSTLNTQNTLNTKNTLDTGEASETIQPAPETAPEPAPEPALEKVELTIFGPEIIPLTPAGTPAETSGADGELPLPLSNFDVIQYQRLFAMQEVGRMKQANREMGRLQNDILVGRLLSQRYLHPNAWRSTYGELSRWLAAYNDHPDASRIYWLAKKRRPKNKAMPKAPKSGYLNGYGLATSSGYRPRIPASNAGRASPRKTRGIALEIRRAIRLGWPSGALQTINAKSNLRYLTKGEEAQLRGEIAHAYFIFGLDDKAITQGRYAIGAKYENAQMGYWASGLAAWRSGDIGQSGMFFRTLAELPEATPSLRSAAAFWAHRVEMREGRPASATRFLEIAASELNSFYGVVARQALGQTIPLSFELPPKDQQFIEWVAARDAGQRLFAFLQIGRINDAERELRYLWVDMSDDLKVAALRFAMDHGLAGLAYRAGELLRKQSGRVYYSALYPIPKFDVEFTVDQALVWSIARQESGFNPNAKSSAKAAGLMQLMPATASFITRNKSYRTRDRHLLFDPATNITIGQTYINHLLDESLIENSVVRLLAAYNGGPGNLRKWLRKVNHQDDVFLLIESIPARETRYYVKNVLINLAMYRMQLGEQATSLRGLAAGGTGILQMNIAK